MTQLMFPWILFSTTLGVALTSAAWLAVRCAMFGRRCRAAEAQCDAARRGEAFVARTLQLFAHELQAMALTLRGHADQLSAERHDNAPRMAAAAAQLGGLADELCHHLLPTGQPSVLECEAIELAPLVQEAIATMQVSICPGRRNWRVRQDAPPGLILWADRRALRLVLVRVLGEAVRSSAHDDWIEIGWSVERSGLVVQVEDEGSGTALPTMAETTLDSRGIGLRLALARSLTQAHGGALEVEALARIGTRVTIALPADLLRSG